MSESANNKHFQELIDRRLKGICMHWNNACDNYFNLDLFVININSAIQDLRNITFLLQKHKHLYGDFDSWYTEKQEEMKADDKLRRIVDSRNKIVKQEDLKVNSLAYMSLVNWKEISLPSIELDPFLSNDEIVALFLLLIKNKKIEILSKAMGMPVLQIKKLWIDKDYPDVEILLLIKYGFDYLKSLLSDFLALIGTKSLLDEKIDVNVLESKKNYFLDVNDCSVFSKKVIKIDFNDEKITSKMKEIANKIIGDIKMPQNIDGAEYDVDGMLSSFLEIAKRVVQEGEEHKPTFIYLSKEYKPINISQGYIEDRASKYVWIRSLADEIKNNSDIFAVLSINEAWVVAKNDGPEYYDNPSSDVSKGEEIMINFLNRDGLNKDLHLPIYRTKGKIKFGKITSNSGSMLGVLAPIADVWGLIG